MVGNQVQFNPGTDFDDLAVGQTEIVVISYSISDEHGATDSSTITVTVTGANDAPVAVADTNGGDPVVESGSIRATRRSRAIPRLRQRARQRHRRRQRRHPDRVRGQRLGRQCRNGGGRDLRLGDDRRDGSYTYTLNNADPDTNALAQGASVNDVFSYTAQDGSGATSTTTLTITITGTNDAPVAVADTNGGDAVSRGRGQSGQHAVPGRSLGFGQRARQRHRRRQRRHPGGGRGQRLGGNVGAAVAGTYGSVTIAATAATPTRSTMPIPTPMRSRRASRSTTFHLYGEDANGATSTARSRSRSPAPTTRRRSTPAAPTTAARSPSCPITIPTRSTSPIPTAARSRSTTSTFPIPTAPASRRRASAISAPSPSIRSTRPATASAGISASRTALDFLEEGETSPRPIRSRSRTPMAPPSPRTSPSP